MTYEISKINLITLLGAAALATLIALTGLEIVVDTLTGTTVMEQIAECF